MNPNSENGSISMAGNGTQTFEIDSNSDGTGDVDAQASNSSHFTVKPGQGLFAFKSDYSGLGSIDPVDSDSEEDSSAEASELATEYIMVASMKDTSNVNGMSVGLLQNKLDGTNSGTAATNVTDNLIKIGSLPTMTPSFFMHKEELEL